MEMERSQQRLLNVLIRKALDQASLALLRMTSQGRPDGGIELEQARIRFIPITQVPEITGDASQPVVAVYVGIEGDLHGHAMLMMTAESACRVSDMLMGQPVGTTTALDNMALSALSEAGNVCVSGFLNALSDDLKFVILPTTPQVVEDMAGAILASVAADLYLSGEDVLLIETGFVGDESVPGHFLLMLDRDSRLRMLGKLRQS